MKIRRLTRDDSLDAAAVLFDAYRQFYRESANLAVCKQWLHDRLQRDESAIFLAEDDEGAKGFMQLYPGFCSVSLTSIWTLYDLFVTPSARGRGIAAMLLSQAKAFGEANGAGYLQLTTAHDNLTAQRQYDAAGWQQDLVFRTYTLPLNHHQQ